MKIKYVYPIRYVAQQTGLSTHVIRVWEKRYQAVVPKRTETNRRMFCGKDIERLKMLKTAIKVGHSISQIAGLSFEELIQLVRLDVSDTSKVSAAREPTALDATYFYKRSLSAVLNFDAESLESVLDRAAVHLSKLELIKAIIEPLCQKIGELWEQGELKIINEHMTTTVIQSFLWNLLRSAEVSETSPKIVIATPAGHQHELGALAVALIACESNWRSLYFGPSLPAEEIAAAVKYADARAVALSITHHEDSHQLNLEVKKLRRYLGDDISIFIGGQGASPLVEFFDANEIQVLKDAESFRTALNKLRILRQD
ncbi:MAG: MerR family transcriptional regulator [Desulfobacterales bacterium]|jgi:DNA-binding transcriptional MerR regulator/methylmalonyl-CoA mutase cobalamin-binding subunit